MCFHWQQQTLFLFDCRFTYIPPSHDDRALMFDSEIRGQLAILMGGRAAEMITCSQVSTGALDDIRRATQLAHRAVSEFGLSTLVGPMNVGILSTGGADDGGLFPRCVLGCYSYIELVAKLM